MVSVGLSKDEQYALLLSTLAGLSTSIGGLIAIIKRPGPALLSFLLGLAIGVMVTLSVAEMWLRNALEHGFLRVSASVACGSALYFFVQPFLPDFEEHDHGKKGTEQYPDDPPGTGAASLRHNGADASAALLGGGSMEAQTSGSGAAVEGTASATATAERLLKPRPSSGGTPTAADAAAVGEVGGAAGESTEPGGLNMAPSGMRAEAGGRRAAAARSTELLRLGFVMALAMTLHNLPEGFAVAFSAFTDFGGIMALAIAIHNIPEGVIVAAPVYAATGSRCKAMGIAVASGLSEPLGALIALLFVKPLLTPLLLQFMLAFVGGIMMAVCALELYPEARKCGHDMRLGQGAALGTAVMAWTLYIGI
ncbi:hypothetical protein WJX81_002306 [Elliptochloris bilobata]|uniref:Uncharacterized protein n=1 Tax=Elliptochloris bilobata TaxID=381761 RepID=A0AAW1RMW3_9CHLO